MNAIALILMIVTTQINQAVSEKVYIDHSYGMKESSILKEFPYNNIRKSSRIVFKPYFERMIDSRANGGKIKKFKQKELTKKERDDIENSVSTFIDDIRRIYAISSRSRLGK